jgi:tetratricopeptide (TPR) repeat protein
VLEAALAANPVPADQAELELSYGLLLAQQFDQEEGMRQLRSARETFEVSDGPTSDGVFRARRQIASLLQDQGRLTEAAKELDAVLEIARKAGAKSGWATDLHAFRSKFLLAQGQHEAALREARRAIELLVARGDKELHLVVALCVQGLALLELGRVDEAVKIFERGLAAFTGAPDFLARGTRADLQAGLARALVRKGTQRERACKLTQEAASFYRTRIFKRHIQRDLERWLSQHRCSPEA